MQHYLLCGSDHHQDTSVSMYRVGQRHSRPDMQRLRLAASGYVPITARDMRRQVSWSRLAACRNGAPEPLPVLRSRERKKESEEGVRGHTHLVKPWNGSRGMVCARV